MRRKAGLILLALAVFCAALSPLLRWYAFPRLAKIPANEYQTMVLEAKNATLLDYGTMTARTVPKVTIVQTLKGDVAASEKIEKTGLPGRRRVGRPVLRPGPRRQDGLQGPRALHLRRPHPGTRARHRRDGRRRPGPADGHRVQVAVPDAETGLRVLRRADPHQRPHPLQGHPELPRPQGLLLRADRPLDRGRPAQDDARRRRSPPRPSPRPAPPAGTPRSASSGSNRSPERPSTARRSTRRNCAADPCSAAARRSPRSPGT